MTKRRTLHLVLTPAMVAKLNAQPHVHADGVNQLLSSFQVDTSSVSVGTRVQKQELLAQRVQMLQPLLRPKGASGSYYSRKALAQDCCMPYHMLKPHDERQPISPARL